MQESGEWERWKSVSVSGGQVETVVAVLALVCLTWPDLIDRCCDLQRVSAIVISACFAVFLNVHVEMTLIV